MFNWHKTFTIVPLWKKGKKTTASKSEEVVLTQVKKLQNGYGNDMVAAPSCLNGDLFLHADHSSDCQNDLTIKENTSKSVYDNTLSEFGATESLCQLKRLYKFESEDSGVEMPSGANSPSTPTDSEKSFVIHSRDSSCDSGVLSASSSPMVDHVEIKACTDKAANHTFLPDIEDTGNVQEAEDPETTMEAFIDSQEEDDLDLSSCSNQTTFENKPAVDGLSNTDHSAVMADEDSKAINDFYKDTFDGIQDLHTHSQLKRYPTSDSLDEYMDECCRLSEVNQGASKAIGSGLGYLEHICQLIEKIGQLQEHNLRLQKQVFALQKEDKMKQMRQEYFVQHCSCGAASVLLSSYQEARTDLNVRRSRPHSMFVQSGNQSDLSMIPETGVNYEKFNYKGPSAQTDGKNSPSILGFRKPFNKIIYEEGEQRTVCERNYSEALPQQDQEMKKLDMHPWGRVRDLLKKTKIKNPNKLGLSSAALKRSCPQLYRPDIVSRDIQRKERNSMIVLGQNAKRENAWSSVYLLNRKEEDV
ncbi:uncharacterized protein LOC142501273 [Ascaphus truei]|uniref:uncharacterized protein LOC142501273 n=1 Tax=Ascaphus truei TaxID=8439 RepID=UPI003F5902F4